MLISLKRILKSGLYNFSRNKFTSYSAILISTITMMVLIATIILHFLFTDVLNKIKDNIDINVFLSKEASEEETAALIEELKTEPTIKEINYYSNDKVLTDFLEKNKDDEIVINSLKDSDGNPLRAVINIKAHQPSSYEGIAELLENKKNELDSNGLSIIEHQNYYDKNINQAIFKFNNIIRYVDIAIFFIALILLSASILVNLNTIRIIIYNTKDEIHIMRMVGSSNNFIRGPFIVQGLLYGFFASTLSVILYIPITIWLTNFIKEVTSGVDIYQFYISNILNIYIFVLIFSFILGLISALIATDRYLKKL